MFDVSVAGNLVSVRPGSGIISRCPECNRVIQKGNCRVHGKVEGIWDMQDRLSYLVDIRVVALIVAKKFGCNISGIYDRVSRSVLGISY